MRTVKNHGLGPLLKGRKQRRISGSLYSRHTMPVSLVWGENLNKGTLANRQGVNPKKRAPQTKNKLHVTHQKKKKKKHNTKPLHNHTHRKKKRNPTLPITNLGGY